jgi:hypothetical protein
VSTKTLGVAVALLFFLPGISPASQSGKITSAEAKNHVGEKEIVCGHVSGTRYADKTKGQPTFLDLDGRYPNSAFTVLIWGSDRAKFGEPETKYADSDVCVSGTISSYRGAPEIVATDPTQITKK